VRGGAPGNVGPVLSLLGNRGTTGRLLIGVMYRSPPYLTLFILGPSVVY
jgi:hypothetical protein